MEGVREVVGHTVPEVLWLGEAVREALRVGEGEALLLAVVEELTEVLGEVFPLGEDAWELLGLGVKLGLWEEVGDKEVETLGLLLRVLVPLLEGQAEGLGEALGQREWEGFELPVRETLPLREAVVQRVGDTLTVCEGVSEREREGDTETEGERVCVEDCVKEGVTEGEAEREPLRVSPELELLREGEVDAELQGEVKGEGEFPDTVGCALGEREALVHLLRKGDTVEVRVRVEQVEALGDPELQRVVLRVRVGEMVGEPVGEMVRVTHTVAWVFVIDTVRVKVTERDCVTERVLLTETVGERDCVTERVLLPDTVEVSNPDAPGARASAKTMEEAREGAKCARPVPSALRLIPMPVATKEAACSREAPLPISPGRARLGRGGGRMPTTKEPPRGEGRATTRRSTK